MRAVICPSLGDETGLRTEEVAPPAMIAGGVRIAIAAAGVNFADGLVIAGRYQEKLEPPFIPGFEVAGTVIETAPDVTGFTAGDRVMAVVDSGGFAEQVVARATDTHRLPDRMDWATAAGFPIVYGTSHHSLAARAALKAGETLLVLGAAGGVGLTAVEIGRALGATVIASAGGPAKTEVARAHGAHAVIDYREEPLRDRVKALTGGKGADVVYDPVGGDLFDQALRSLAPAGRLLAIGFASGAIPQIPANILLVKNLSVIGYHWGAYRRLDPAGLADSFRQLLGWFDQGLLSPIVSWTLPLDRAAEAIGLLKSRQASGKLVLTV